MNAAKLAAVAFVNCSRTENGRTWTLRSGEKQTGDLRKTENLLKTVAAPAAFPRRLQISLGVRLHVKDEERSWFLIFNVIRGVRSWFKFAFVYVLMMPCLVIV